MANKKESKVEDIFAETDKTAPRPPRVKQPAVTQKAANQPPAAGPVPPSDPGSTKRSKAPMFVLLVFIVIVLLGVGWLAVSGTLFNKNKEIVSNSNYISVKTTPVDTNTQSVDLPTVNNEVVDTDSDGLTDEEEKELGTSITNNDSDDDGLFDREEVKVYKTDPLKKDTDGDGNTDGAEVAKGYNPNGPGKLFDLQADIEDL